METPELQRLEHRVRELFNALESIQSELATARVLSLYIVHAITEIIQENEKEK